MIEFRAKESLGAANYGWLNTRYHFSFSSYYDPMRVNWGQLRVWNNDIIQPKTGFPTHPHNNMEIITYVYEGAIIHTDSMGNQGRTEAGDVQVMSAGRGVTHSEYNLEEKETRLFQIWIIPDKQVDKPSWGTKRFPKAEKTGRFSVLASGHACDKNALSIQAQARVLAMTLLVGQTVEYHLANKKAYIVAARGKYQVNGQVAFAGDGLAIEDEEMLHFSALEASEIVMVELG
ncbi:pirin family protein [Utexia brackfieldae]|uniref:pirin family protein n=1 Tax=Utexia brackfieldae TaxID=3074108 RepID=UPI00370D316D